MDTKYLFIIAVVAVVILVALFMGTARRKKSEQHHGQLKDEFDLTVKTAGGEKEALAELDERQKRVETLALTPLQSLTMSATRLNGLRSNPNSLTPRDRR
jgi:hypothetical protein